LRQSSPQPSIKISIKDIDRIKRLLESLDADRLVSERFIEAIYRELVSKTSNPLEMIILGYAVARAGLRLVSDGVRRILLSLVDSFKMPSGGK